MSACSEQLCRGGLSCCHYDAVLQAAYCLTETACTPNTSTTGFVVIFVILVLATVGVALVLYCRWRSLVTDSYTMSSFVDQEMYSLP